MNISVVILTKNEDKNIERAIKSVLFCDEIIIVDDYSIDDTLNEISKLPPLPRLRRTSKIQNDKSKIKIIKRELNENFAEQRNYAIKQARGDWILFVDADEEITRKLEKEIKKVMSYELGGRGGKVKAYYLKRRDWWWGRELKYGETMTARNSGIIRLMKKNSGRWQGKVHEEFRIQNSEFRTKTLKNYINHYPHPTVREFLQEINFYSSLRAKELFSQRRTTNIIAIIFYPFFKFLYTYFIKLGFLDGPAGFAYAFMMSFHSFLVRTKLYQYTKIDR